MGLVMVEILLLIKIYLLLYNMKSLNLQRFILLVYSQNGKLKSIIIIYIWNLKQGTNELIYKIDGVTDVENKLMVTRVKRVEG